MTRITVLQWQLPQYVCKMKDRRSQSPQEPEKIPEYLALNAKQHLEREIGIIEHTFGSY